MKTGRGLERGGTQARYATELSTFFCDSRGTKIMIYSTGLCRAHAEVAAAALKGKRVTMSLFSFVRVHEVLYSAEQVLTDE